MLYACAGCPEFGYGAPRVARRLDEHGAAEMIWLGTEPAIREVTQRFPIVSLDACEKRCARAWVEARGATVQRAFLLAPQERDDAEGAAERILALLL